MNTIFFIVMNTNMAVSILLVSAHSRNEAEQIAHSRFVGNVESVVEVLPAHLDNPMIVTDITMSIF